MKRSDFCMFAALLLVLLYAPAVAGAAQKGCEDMPLLAGYKSGGLLRQSPEGALSLELVADLHFADCGAPDCYGTKITITMNPSAEGRSCVVRDVLVHTQDFVSEGCESLGELNKPRTEVYVPEGGRGDLGEPALQKLTLRNADSTRAIVLLRENFFYFEDATRGGILRTELPGDDDDKSCCWVATSSGVHFMR